jgi:ubiquinone/menaquinone biosynthesis C-methylase UbiE
MNKETAVSHKNRIIERFSSDSEYWREVYADSFDENKTFLSIEMIERKKAVLAFVNQYAGKQRLSVLDVGCGSGVIMKEILERGHSVTGMDITQAMLEQAKSTVGQYLPDSANCILGDVENIPAKDGSFDAVLSVGVLQYLHDDHRGVSEISRVVKDGGLVIITLPNIFRVGNFLDPYYFFVRAIQYLRYKSPFRKVKIIEARSSNDFNLNDTFVNRRYYFGQLSGLFRLHCLSKVDLAGIGFGPITFWLKKLLPDPLSIRISRFIQRMSRIKCFSFLNIFANRWVICLKKQGDRRNP